MLKVSVEAGFDSLIQYLPLCPLPHRGKARPAFTACQSHGFASSVPSHSSRLVIVLSVLLLFNPFLDLRDFGSCDGRALGVSRYATSGIIPAG